MSRMDFMNELESLLSNIPIEEKEEALQYYSDYFEDAGADHEEEIMKELVSPQRIATIIKAEMNANAADRENRGYFTEKGYQDTIYKDEKFEIIGTANKEEGNQNKTDSTGSTGNFSSEQKIGGGTGTYQNNQQQNNQQQNNQQQNYQQQNKQNKNTNIGLIILLCIFAIPIGLPLILSFFGVFIGILAAVFGVIFGFGAAGISMMGVGIALFIAGLVQIGVPLIGLLLCGSGLLVLGLGMLFTLVSALLCKKVLPAMVRGIVNICRLPFRNRSVTA